MAKPKTSYSQVTTSQSSTLLNSTTVTLNSTIQLLSGFTSTTLNQLNTKLPNSYTSPSKNNTLWALNTSASNAWILSTTSIALTNLVYLLNGYLTATSPNQLHTKNVTAYSGASKNKTTYARNSSASSSWFLNSSLLTLASAAYYMNGYLTSIAPNQEGNKNLTAYTAV